MATLTRLPNPAEQAIGEQFRVIRNSRSAEGSAGGREDAFARFMAAGLPGRRIESWHYTDLRGLLRDALPPAAEPDAATVLLARERLAVHALPGAVRIVILDGHYVAELSDVAALGTAVRVSSVLEALAAGTLASDLVAAQALGAPEAMLALNAAFLQGGVFVEIEAGAELTAPIEIVNLLSGRTPAATYDRSYVAVGAGAAVTLVERHAALGVSASFADTVLVAAVSDGARLDHLVRVDGLGPQGLHFGTTLVRLGAKARFDATTLVATDGITRRQAYLEFAGPDTVAHFQGVALLDGRAQADTTLIVTHTAPRCESRELYKHVLADESTGIYQGKVVVSPGAQKSDGKMMSRAIFLGEGATMYNKPELEIFADDVVCGHGATVGSLDEQQLFYLRARGIPLREAQALLLEAFAVEGIEAVAAGAVRDEFGARIGAWLRRHGE